MSKAGPLLSSESMRPRRECLTSEKENAEQWDSQQKKKRQHGIEAVKSHIVAARTVANIVKTSLVRSTREPNFGLSY